MVNFSNKGNPKYGRLSEWHEEEKTICQDFRSQATETAEPEEWTPLIEAVAAWAGFVEQRKNLAVLTARVEALERRLSEANGGSFHVPIQTLDPEPFDLLKEIKVVVRPSDEEFVATFFDANVNAGGCTSPDAVRNLKELLVRRFDHLDKIPIEKLGPAMVKQIAVLRSFIRRRA